MPTVYSPPRASTINRNDRSPRSPQSPPCRKQASSAAVAQDNNFGRLAGILAFWLWLGKDLIFVVLPPLSGGGELALITISALSLCIYCHAFAKRLIKLPLVTPQMFGWGSIFLLYLTISTFSAPSTAFQHFKLISVAISILMGIVCAHTVMAYDLLSDPRFAWVGIILGGLGAKALFAGANGLDRVIGLRGLSVAHLNIQDYFVELWLVTLVATLVLPASARSNLCLLAASAVSVPCVILMNSRMIPFTVGVTIAFAVYKCMPRIRKSRAPLRRLIYLSCIGAGVVFGIATFTDADMRMLSIFRSGLADGVGEDPRSVSYSIALDNFATAPVFGIGFGTFTFPGMATDVTERTNGFWPHNLYLELLSELGLCGFLLYGIPTTAIVWGAIARNRLSGRGGEIASVFLIYAFITAQLSHNLWYPVVWVGYCLTYYSQRMRRVVT